MLRLRQSAYLFLDRLDLFPKALQSLVFLLVIYQTAAEGEHVLPGSGRTRPSIAPVLAKVAFLFLLLCITVAQLDYLHCGSLSPPAHIPPGGTKGVSLCQPSSFSGSPLLQPLQPPPCPTLRQVETERCCIRWVGREKRSDTQGRHLN